MQSSEINELAAALSKAQEQMSTAHKDSDNPFFRSKYADLESVWDACRKAFGDNGLSVTQVGATGEKGTILKTTLMHKSGQWIESELPLIMAKNDMQALGSAMTYARRFSLMGIAGIVPSENLPERDDDGETAVGRGLVAEVFSFISAESDAFKNKEKLKKLTDHFGSSQTIRDTDNAKLKILLETYKV